MNIHASITFLLLRKHYNYAYYYICHCQVFITLMVAMRYKVHSYPYDVCTVHIYTTTIGSLVNTVICRLPYQLLLHHLLYQVRNYCHGHCMRPMHVAFIFVKYHVYFFIYVDGAVSDHYQFKIKVCIYTRLMYVCTCKMLCMICVAYEKLWQQLLSEFSFTSMMYCIHFAIMYVMLIA